LVALPLAWVIVPQPLRAQEVTASIEEVLLQEARVGTNDESLLKYLQRLSPSDEDLLDPDRLIRQLSAPAYQQREDAQRRLIALGPVALPALQPATKNADSEVARRAKVCAERIERTADQLPLAAVRLLLRRKAVGAAEAFLRYLPYSADPEVEEEVYYGLEKLVGPSGRGCPALAAALNDRLPARRAVAGCLLGRIGDAEQRAAVRKLLADASPVVRLRAAQGLLAAADGASLPALVQLLDEPSAEIAWQAEELLHWVAGKEAPAVAVGAATAGERKACRAAWEGWLSRCATGVNWAQVGAQVHAPRLLLVMDAPRRYEPDGSRVWLCGCDGKPRWVLRASDAQDARWSGAGVLVAEGAPASRISQRGLDGSVGWKLDLEGDDTRGAHAAERPTPDCCARLLNGSLLVSYGMRVVRGYSPYGESQFVYSMLRKEPPSFPFKAYQFPYGLAACLESSFRVHSVVAVRPRDGKVILRLATNINEDSLFGSLVVYRGDGTYEVNTMSGRYYEVGAADGKVARATTRGPGVGFVTRLHDGSLLTIWPVSTANRVMELSGENRVTWGASADRLERVRVCFPLVSFGFVR
jgi:hypothetical protein